jgi:hypothetical protein
VAEQTAFQDELLRRLGETRERAGAIQRLVWALDFLSLAPLTGWTPEDQSVPSTGGGPDTTIHVDGEDRLTVSVDPWPFTRPEPFQLHYTGRLLAGPVETQEELDAALRDAAWTSVVATWSPE